MAQSNHRATRVSDEFMPLVLILAVGQDPVILNTRSSILRSAGHVVVSASSVAESIALFQDADFDLVLLCHSLPLKERDRLTRAIRASGSHIPIYTLAAISGETQRGFADGVISSGPKNLVAEVEQAVRNASALVINARQP